MKEVTEWDNNPREMWVWDTLGDKRKAYVIAVLNDDTDIKGAYHVIARARESNIGFERWRHCADIERQRLMTNKELARWLAEKPNREFRNSNNVNAIVGRDYQYYLNQGDDEVPDDVYVRDGDSPWYVPLAEEEE